MGWSSGSKGAFTSLDAINTTYSEKNAKTLIDESVARIQNILDKANPPYEHVYYSASSGQIDIGIYKKRIGPDIVAYVSKNLQKIRLPN
jgi:hypothetical protein